jgi:hypothetical protein
MAAPQFSMSGAKPSKTRRRFTLQQANKALPLVTRIVRDIVNTHERATQLQAKLEEANSRDANLQAQLDSSLEQLQDYVDELAGIGVELKDYESGLIDFPGRHQGRDIYLCWKLGEDKVDHWHELHSGYAGRQSTSTLEEEE